MRLTGYRTLLKMLYANPALSDTNQVALFTGYVGCLVGGRENATCLTNVDLIPFEDRASLLALRKMLLSWCATQLQQVVYECESQAAEIELHSKSRMVVFLVTLLNGATAAEEMEMVVALRAASLVLALRKLVSYPKEDSPVKQEEMLAVLDEGANVRRSAFASGDAASSATCLSGPEAAALMKIGVRVLRGPDWKWGDQVIRR